MQQSIAKDVHSLIKDRNATILAFSTSLDGKLDYLAGSAPHAIDCNYRFDFNSASWLLLKHILFGIRLLKFAVLVHKIVFMRCCI